MSSDQAPAVSNSSQDISKVLLANGTTVLVDRDDRFKSVAYSVCLCGGQRSEKASDVGLTHVLEHLLFKRTARRNTKDIAAVIDRLGGEINAFTDADSLCLHGVVPADRLEQLIDLFAELLCENDFTPEDLALEKEVIRQEILEAQDDPFEVVFQRFSECFWPDSLLGMPVCGYLETLERFDYTQVRGRLEALLQGSRLIVAAAGDVDPERVVQHAQRHFGHFVKGARDSLITPTVGCGVHFVPRPVGQVQLALGSSWPGVCDKRYSEATAVATVLGDGMSSRLFQLLREDRGLVYDVSAEVDAHADTGALVISAASERSSVNTVVDLILGEIEKVHKDLISDEELARAVQYQTARLDLEADDISSRLWRAVESEITFQRYVSSSESRDRYLRLDLEDIRQFIDKWFSTTDKLLVLGGDVEGLELSSAVT